MGSKEEFSGETEKLPHQSPSGRGTWRPNRLGYGGRQWSHRPRTELENDLTRQAYREQQSLEPIVLDLGRDGKTPGEYLTANGLSLLKILTLGDRDMATLSWYAKQGDFDLRAALDELREYKLLGETDSKLIGLVKKRL